MKSILVILGMGVLVWLVPFLAGMATMPIIHTHHPLFETIMTISLIVGTTVISLWFISVSRFKNMSLPALGAIGTTWIIIGIALDIPIMILGSAGMSVHEYFADVGMTYLGIPVILMGLGYATRLSNA